MTLRAKEEGAINLAQGIPSFPTPSFLIKEARKALEKHNQYVTTIGHPLLRQAIASWIEKKYHLSYDPHQEITITCGVSEGIVAASLSLLKPGDKALVMEPFYENYLPAITFAKGTPLYLQLDDKDNWKLKKENLYQHNPKDVKAVFLNNPHNPTGHVFSKEELSLLASWIQEGEGIIISDDIYQDIVYSPATYTPMPSLSGMRDRTVWISGFGKAFSVTGWRVGFVCAPKAITRKIRVVHDFTTICSPHPFQIACIQACSAPPSYFHSLQAYYQENRGILMEGLKNLGFTFHTPQGGYYLFAQYENLSRLPPTAFAQYLVQNQGVAVVPGDSFYHDGKDFLYVRFSFGKTHQEIKEALRRLTHRFGK